MNRRRFLEYGSRVVALSPILGPLVAERLVSPVYAQAIPAAVMNRIAISTDCFRLQFKTTFARGQSGPPANLPPLDLLTAPKYIADQVGIHNVEIWAPHFEDLSIDYCRQIKATAAAAGSRIVNVQLDVLNPPDYDLQAANDSERVRSIAFVKEWMDRTAAVGAPHLRVNPGGRPGDPVPERVIDSYRQLAAYGKTINVKVLVENHTGLSRPIPGCIEIVKRVNDPFCRALSDWGNTPAASQTARVEALTQMFPLIEFVSAKEVDFDEQNRHISYDIVPIIEATEASGYRGIYSIELWGDRHPVNVVSAVKDMMQTVAQNIRG
jgi:sugar phosphate isomerase/epimerase